MSLVPRERDTSDDEQSKSLEHSLHQVDVSENENGTEGARVPERREEQPRERIVYCPILIMPRIAPAWNMPWRPTMPWFNPFGQRYA